MSIPTSSQNGLGSPEMVLYPLPAATSGAIRLIESFSAPESVTMGRYWTATGPAMTQLSPVQMVTEFHRAFGLPVRAEPDIDIPTAEAELRIRLILEEVAEVETAIANRDLANLAGELTDLVYVVIGTAIQYGIPFDAVFAEVHRANMSKLGPDGVPVLREDGEIIKPFGFKPAGLSAVLDGSQPKYRRMVNSNNA